MRDPARDQDVRAGGEFKQLVGDLNGPQALEHVERFFMNIVPVPRSLVTGSCVRSTIEKAPFVSSFEAMNFSFPESIGKPSISLVFSATTLDVFALCVTVLGRVVWASDSDSAGSRSTTAHARKDNRSLIRHLLKAVSSIGV
jgi:hypothetical protein